MSEVPQPGGSSSTVTAVAPASTSSGTLVRGPIHPSVIPEPATPTEKAYALRPLRQPRKSPSYLPTTSATDEFKRVLKRDCNTLLWLWPPGCTNEVQPVDAGFGRLVVVYVAQTLDELLLNGDNVEL